MYFTEDLEPQFRQLIEGIKTTFRCTSADDAIGVHAVLRAHLLEIGSKQRNADRVVSLEGLRRVIKSHRSVVLECAYADFLGDERYIQHVAKRWFPKQLNKSSHDTVFVFDLVPGTEVRQLAQIVSALSGRMFERLKAGPVGSPPIVAFRGLDEDRYSAAVRRVYETLAASAGRSQDASCKKCGRTDSPLVR